MSIRGTMKYDKRIIDRNIRSGLVTQEEYDKFVETLPDLTHSAEALESELQIIDKELPSADMSDEDEL